MNEAFKPLGVITIAASWAMLLFLIYNWRGDKSMTFSKHAAAHKRAFRLMMIAQSTVLPTYFLFVLKWFRPAFELPNLFVVCFGLGVLGFIVAAWVPDNGGRNSMIHGLGAYSAAWLMIPATALIAVSPHVGDMPRVVAYLALTYMVLSISLAASTKSAESYQLYVQMGYLLMFNIVILAATYIR